MAKTPETRPGNPGVPANRPRGFGHQQQQQPKPQPQVESEEDHDQGEELPEQAAHAERSGGAKGESPDLLNSPLAGPIGGALFAAFIQALLKALAEMFGTDEQQMKAGVRHCCGE